MTNSLSRSTRNTPKFLPPAGAVSLREASARDVPNLRTRYRACDHSNPLTIHPPSLFYTTHLHNQPTILRYHKSRPLSTTTTSLHEQHLPERNNFKLVYHEDLVGVCPHPSHNPLNTSLDLSSHLRPATINTQSFVNYTR